MTPTCEPMIMTKTFMPLAALCVSLIFGMGCSQCGLPTGGDAGVSDVETADASADPFCGDGIVNNGNEVCDDGVNSGVYGGCNEDCLSRPAHCGDGEIQNAQGEVCDDGVNDGAYGGCASDCSALASYCGDGISDDEEACDEGVNDGAYGGCNDDCTLASYCGDSIVDEAQGEVCDNGDNSAESDCNNCLTQSVCGNSVVEAGEVCDDGVNDGSYSGCSSDCKSQAPRCGDGIVQSESGELCDDTVNDGTYGTCDQCLTFAPRCGDGILQAQEGERCDDGTNEGAYGSCMPGCTLYAPRCGDAQVQSEAGEVCDTGDNVGGYNGCNTDCLSTGPRCGDGIVQAGFEVCDDGINAGGYGGCAPDCSALGGRCGDGIVQNNEACDDGVNNGAYGGCNADCLSVGPRCGDGVVQANETCDDGVNDNGYNGCAATCQTRGGYCGDNIVQENFETCDDGVNAGAPGCDACTADGPVCGDGIVHPGETCDDGVNDGAYGGCQPGCDAFAPRCGDNIVQANESCDDGQNLGGYNACEPGCQNLGPRCGDGEVQTSAGEVCDDAVNDNSYDGCAAGCQALGPRCGDNVVQANETCDDGQNLGAYEGCAAGCQALGPRCGDGNVQANETCDDGVNDNSYDGCAAGCQALGPRCGDGNVQANETCDDGVNDNSYEGCAPGCAQLGPRCGDGALQAQAGEVCDDGVNDNSYDGCAPTCLARGPRCGDGAVQAGEGEVCDDGVNDNSYEGCAQNCDALGPRCGDSVVQGALGEVCDDGVNDNGYEGCAPGCNAVGPNCGDAIVQAADGETCDDGVNDNSYGSCTPVCALGPRCGDNIVQAAQGEICDDGVNDNSYDGCTPACDALGPRCGDGAVQAADGEVCDDGVNDNSYDGCASTCDALGPRCGDGVVQAAEGEVCDDGVNNGDWNAGAGCNPGCAATPVPPRVLINEIMYHPVKEDDYVDNHEFVEIINDSGGTVDLGGWIIAGGIEFAFAANTILNAGEYLVIAKNRTALLAEYALSPDDVVGDFAKSLGNGGDTILLQRDDGSLADTVTYDDDFPWSSAADSLGAGSEWLDPAILPTSSHQFRGYSLERVSLDSDSNAPENWVTSVLDNATPAAANTGVRATPLPIVVFNQVHADGALPDIDGDFSRLIFDSENVRFSIAFSAAVSNPRVEYFIDDLNVSNEPVSFVSLADDGLNGDAAAGDLNYTATLPAMSERTLVRYRIRADRGAGDEVVSPRENEPFVHSFYITPDYSGKPTRTYDILIGTAEWTSMWTNISAGRVTGPQVNGINCTVNPTWDDREAAVFVHEGHVYDVRVRHQGSRYQRRNGTDIAWPFDGPDQPAQLKSLSWRVAFPRYDRFNKRATIHLNKMKQTCPGFENQLTYEMAKLVDVPGPKKARFARVLINGGYYNYMLELDRMGDLMMEKYHEDFAAKYNLPEDPVGHLYKARGFHGREGPWSIANGSVISNDQCGFTPAEQYAATYDRKTNGFEDNSNFIAMLEGMHGAAALGDTELRNFFDANWDVPRILDYMSLRNYHRPWDDNIHNYFMYQNRVSGKWLMVAWDNDLTFGGRTATASLYSGEQDNPNQGSFFTWWKTYFFRVYRTEHYNRIQELNDTLFHPTVLKPMLQAIYDGYDGVDAADAQTPIACNADDRKTGMDDFIDERHAYIAAQPAP